MSLISRCLTCDAPIDSYGRDGVECDRCKADLPPVDGTIIAKWPAAWGENPMLTTCAGDPMLKKRKVAA